jgi:signal peptidase II
MLYILIIAAIVLLEYKVKQQVEQKLQLGDRKEILQGKIILKKQYNRGMFLNFMEDKVEIVKKASIILLGVLLLIFTFMIPRRHNKLLKLGLSLCLGGGISNISDRMKRGYVVDYFSFNCKGLRTIVFNLGDMFILLGSLIILIVSGFKGESCIDKTAE